MGNIVDKYRQECYKTYFGDYNQEHTFRQAILETIFRPSERLGIDPPGKGPMTHLHPNMDKLHMPHGVYIADWRKYKVEDHPALVNFQKKCHAAGLHDPWLRNYCYNFYSNRYGSRTVLALVTKGCATGFFIALGLFMGEKFIIDVYFPVAYEHTPEYKKRHEHGHEHAAHH